MRSTIAILVALLLTSAAVAPLQAGLIAAEDFEYEQATLSAGLNGGFGWADSWTGENFVTPGSLEFAGMASRGHKLTTNPAPGREGTKCSYRAFSTSGNDDLIENGKFGRDNTTLWIGFLVNAPTGLSTGYGGLSLYDDDRQQVFLGDTGASDVYAVERSGQLRRLSSVRADSLVHWFVCRISFRSGEDQIDLWIDPKPGGSEPSEASLAASATVQDFHFNRVRLCSAPVPLNFDALRLGTSFSDLSAVSSAGKISVGPKSFLRQMKWSHLLVIGIIAAIIGMMTLAFLTWFVARRKRLR